MATKETPKLKKLPAKAVKANIAILEDLFLNSNIDTSWMDTTSRHSNDDQLVDIAIATLAQYGNTIILADVIEVEELEHYSYDARLIRTLTQIYALWVDKKFITHRSDNQLIEPQGEERNWKTLMDFEIAQLMTRKGKLMGHQRSNYGWEEYEWKGEKKRPPVAAVFNLREDHWGEFVGTFASGDDSKTGFTCHVMYADGEFRDLRYEGGLGEIMQEIAPKKK